MSVLYSCYLVPTNNPGIDKFIIISCLISVLHTCMYQRDLPPHRSMYDFDISERPLEPYLLDIGCWQVRDREQHERESGDHRREVPYTWIPIPFMADLHSNAKAQE